MKYLVALVFVFLGCTHQPTYKEGAKTLFPDGVFVHKTKIQMKSDNVDFDIATKVTRTSFTTHFLIGFGITVARISEDPRIGDLKVEMFLPGTEKYKDALTRFHRLLRDIHYMDPTSSRVSKRDDQGNPTLWSAGPVGFTTDVKLGEYKDGWPQTIRMTNRFFEADSRVSKN